jgi:hypothetical protein
LPHAPQLVVLVPVAMQVVPQYEVPVGQPQTPAMHDWPVGQVFPQRPQLVVLVVVLTQAVPQ